MSVAPVQWISGPGEQFDGAARCVSDVHLSMTGEEAQDIATIFQALSNPVRVRLLVLLRQTPAGELCVCELVEQLGIAVSRVSQHVRTLEAAGLVRGYRRGSWMWYALDPDRLRMVLPVLGEPSATVR
jgi:ArsR family transcriptional regulator